MKRPRTDGFSCLHARIQWRKRISGSQDAHTEVARAIRRGELERPATKPCTDCGKPAQQYDHRDYNKPLDVQPVCRSCNRRRGPAIWRTAQAAA